MKNTILIFVLIAISFASSGQTNNSTSKFGALAIDRSNGFYYGWSYDYSTLAEAEQKAIEECNKKGGNCTVVLLFSGVGCAAYRTIDGNVGNAYGWGIGNSKEEADKIATKECLKRSNGKPANNFVWSCNSNNSGQLKVLKNLIPSANQMFGLKDVDGDIFDYEGELLNGLPNGTGSQKYIKSGSTYNGSFINGMRNGKGTYHFKSGSRYEGDFKNDRCDGFGTYYFNSGKKYVGEFKNDKFNGQGKMYDANGNIVYEGKYINNEPAN
jgi:hypothetical protein